MQLKDYYHILEVPANATPQEIKLSYRKLALQYHPDKNPDNHFTENHFKEIQEAYSILSNAIKRKKYDEARWLSGMSDRVRRKHNISPEWILQESNQLKSHMASLDTYRMSHRALHDLILELLSDQHLSILRRSNNTVINDQIVEELLQAANHLQSRFMINLAPLLCSLTTDAQLLQRIQMQIKKRGNREKRDKYLPWWVVVATILVCILMFLYGKK